MEKLYKNEFTEEEIAVMRFLSDGLEHFDVTDIEDYYDISENLANKGLVSLGETKDDGDKLTPQGKRIWKKILSEFSDFDKIKDYHFNKNLDYYLSEDHWNIHVNRMLYNNLLVFHEGKEVGAYLDTSGDSFTQPIRDYTSLYGKMFNEAYRLCNVILTTPVPETKVVQIANQAATWKFKNLKDQNGNPIKLEITPNVTDLIESYHILGMVNTILTLANDENEKVDRFMIDLSVYKDNGLPFKGRIHSFAPYNEEYQKFIVATMIDGSYLRPGYDNKSRDEYLRHNIPWYNNLTKYLETAKVSETNTVQRKPGAKEKKFEDFVINKTELDKVINIIKQYINIEYPKQAALVIIGGIEAGKIQRDITSTCIEKEFGVKGNSVKPHLTKYKKFKDRLNNSYNVEELKAYKELFTEK